MEMNSLKRVHPFISFIPSVVLRGSEGRMSFSITNLGGLWAVALMAALLALAVTYAVRRWPRLRRRWKVGYVLIYAYALVLVLHYGASGPNPLWVVGAGAVLLLPGCVLRCDEPPFWRKLDDLDSTQNRGNS